MADEQHQTDETPEDAAPVAEINPFEREFSDSAETAQRILDGLRKLAA